MNNEQLQRVHFQVALALDVKVEELKVEGYSTLMHLTCKTQGIEFQYFPEKSELWATGIYDGDLPEWFAIIRLFKHNEHPMGTQWIVGRKNLAPILVRFFYWMGADTRFLTDAGATLRGHDEIEWGLQMREKGFTLNGNG